MSWRLLGTCCLLLQLLQLLVLAPCCLAGPFDSYIINPKSYLDVTRPAARSNLAAGADPPPSSSSCRDSSSVPCQPAAQISSSSRSAGSEDLAAQQSRGLQQAANPARLLPPYNVCVSSWAPMVRCAPGADQSEFQGYQIELFRLAASEVGWADSDYAFTCMDYSSTLADLQDPAGNCTLVATGVFVSPDNLAAGIKFSWPTYKSGLRVVIHAHLQAGSTWAFSEIFRWEVWLMLGATGIAIGLLVAVLEVVNRTDQPMPGSIDGTHQHGGKKTWQAWLWYSLAKLVHVTPHVGDPACDASRVLVLGYGFLVLVMVSMYTAVAASRMTAASLVHPVHSVEDLAGPSNKLAAASWQDYLPTLQERHHVHATGFSWENEEQVQVMLAALRADKFSALILDAPVLEYVTGTNEDCDLYLVGDVFEGFSLALAFPPAADDGMVFDFSKSIVSLQTYQGALDMLENVYIKTGGTAKCFGSNSGGHGSGETIALEQVSGLWYILLITVGVCMVLTLAHNVRKDQQKMARVRRFSSFLGTNTRGPSVPGGGSGNSVDGGAGGAAGGAAAGAWGLGKFAAPADARETPVQAFISASKAPAEERSATGAAAQQQGQQGRQGQGGARAPSALHMFLGISFAQRQGESDEELESPTSPAKAANRHTRFN